MQSLFQYRHIIFSYMLILFVSLLYTEIKSYEWISEPLTGKPRRIRTLNISMTAITLKRCLPAKKCVLGHFEGDYKHSTHTVCYLWEMFQVLYVKTALCKDAKNNQTVDDLNKGQSSDLCGLTGKGSKHQRTSANLDAGRTHPNIHLSS